MTRCAAAAIAMLCLPIDADEIDDLCRDRWGTDYVMREYCIKEQRGARSRVLQSEQLSPEALMEGARVEAISTWLRQRRLPFLHDEIAAIASTNVDAALYIDCERRARPFAADGTTRFQRLLSCLLADAAN